MKKITVNDRPIQVSDSATLLDAIRLAGVHVPTLCHHPRYPSQAVCRLCLVQLNGQAQLKAACITPANEGDVVLTDTDELKQFRQIDVEWLLARHPNACMRCEVQGNCKLQHLVQDTHAQDRWHAALRGAESEGDSVYDESSTSIARDLSKCVECGLCVQACGDAGQQLNVIGFAQRGQSRLPVTIFEQALVDTACISCGQCTWVCPTGALVERAHWHDVLQVLDDRRRTTVVQVAPATRIAVGEEFGLPSGTVSTGKLIHALRAVGFDYVFDTNFAADLTIMEEGSELLSRVREGGVLPLMTSCCPGWVNWVELNRPDLIPHLSTTRSPQQMHGALTKRGPFAQTLGIDVHGQVIEPFTVSVMPCTAKKDEAHRPGLRGDVDRVLTTRELARLLKARGVALASMPDDGVFDDPLGASTGAAQIFAASGGVMEAVVRAAAHLMGAQEALALEWQALRGVDQGLKTTLIPGVGLVAVCNGIAAAQHLFSTPDWQQMYVAIEVMACHGGCLGGGGEPKSDDPAILQKRMQAVYEIDATAVHRRSYENPSVQSLYAQGLSHPNSPQAHTLLHTGYAARHSLRSVLMRFLDAVDRRDTGTIAQLFHPQALWQTASPLGDIQGLDHIVALVRDRLPSLSAPGGSVQRHRMKNPSSADDLSVVTPNGEECRFTLEIEGALDQPSSVKIKRLTRWLT